ncbi:TIGR02293 family toxin-antitoxin system antitoxin component [Edaphobacter acidisoli]|uniref:TIGR02293 family toxin-antitoxin system antitoxin component n=1 Tax=Edaphobacter acidisoli TaxID=2040573 RepID=A0A916W1F6_9BACT|nr:antitoxin Xre/MbcA/ParS toxin-binding domain-containing protein [Edaphobacter acidisoli]GGA58495.1 TIGR02293 family toxin-antitoxin system antitoxin component [Edaphobacter acidisoli]
MAPAAKAAHVLWPSEHVSPQSRRRGASLGLSSGDTVDLIRKIEGGFSFAALETLESASGLPLNMLASVIGIPERTLARRKSSGRLAPEESERLLRIANLYEKSVELLEGDRKAAATWLTSPKKALNHQSPLAYAKTEIGAREVEDLIGRLEHGVFS